MAKTWAPARSGFPRRAAARAGAAEGAKELGVTVHAVARRPRGEAMKLKPIRIGLYDQYGGSMPSGWTRWLFEKYEFPFEVVYPQALDAGNLKSKFDVHRVHRRARFAAARAGDVEAGGGGRGGAVDPDRFRGVSRMAGRHLRPTRPCRSSKKFVECGRPHRDHRQLHQHRRDLRACR